MNSFKALVCVGSLLLSQNLLANSPVPPNNVDARTNANGFKATLMELSAGTGEWGGSYDAKYFASVNKNGKNIFYFSDDEVNQAWPAPGTPSVMLDVMNINFSAQEVAPGVYGQLGYIYERELLAVASAETDFQVCRVANPEKPEDNSVEIRANGSALPRTVTFKSDAIAAGMMQAKAKVVAQVDAAVAAGQLPEAARDKAIEQGMEKATSQVVAGVDAKFSKEAFSKALYSESKDPRVAALDPDYLESLVLGDEVIGIIQGKRCNPNNAGDEWGKLIPLVVPVIRAEIVDGVLQMRAVVGPFVQGNQIAQGYSIYKQTPGQKASLSEITTILKEKGQ